jgi:phage nucleotide-binding protein
MSTAIIFSPPGGGKTVNSTLVPGKTLLLSSDNSAVVLNNFKRENLTIKPIPTFKDFLDEFEKATTSKQYDTIIVDCLSDIIDGYIVECRESKAFNDIRQAYMLVYTKTKALARKAAHCGTNCIFNCWELVEEITTSSGEIKNRLSPMLPERIHQQVCGLCNVIGRVSTANDKDGNKRWYYVTEPSETLIAKDQLFCRKSCMPEDLFSGKNKK